MKLNLGPNPIFSFRKNLDCVVRTIQDFSLLTKKILNSIFNQTDQTTIAPIVDHALVFTPAPLLCFKI